MRRRRRRRAGCALGCTILAGIVIFLFAGGVALVNRLLQPMLPVTGTPETIVVTSAGAQAAAPVAGCTPMATFGEPGYMSGYVIDVNTKLPIANAVVTFSVYTKTTDCGPLAKEGSVTTNVSGYFTTYPTYQVAPVLTGNNIHNTITVNAANCQALTMPFDSVRDFSHTDAEGPYLVPTPFLGNTIELPC